MGTFYGGSINKTNLAYCVDPDNPKGFNQLSTGKLSYRLFKTNGTNPTNKPTFDAFFSVAPFQTGYHETVIAWTSLPYNPLTTAYAWEVTGYLIVTEAGSYVFRTGSDDGNELQINHNIVTSFYGGRGVVYENSAALNLEVGAHYFQYRMQQGAGGAGGYVLWQTPGSPSFVNIPVTNFGNNDLVDLSANGIKTGLVNSPLYENNYLSFNGNNTALQITNFPQIFSGSVSLNGWFYFSDDTRGILFGNFDSSIDINFEKGVNRTLRLYWNALPDISSTTNVFELNQWNYITLQRNKESNIMQMFVNGVQVYSGSTAGSDYASVTGPFRIGRDSRTGTTALNGRIGLIHIYSKALTIDEILSNFNATRSRYGI